MNNENYSDAVQALENEKKPAITREDILLEARRCVCGEREQDYGSPENNLETIAAFWSTYLESVLDIDMIFLSGTDVSAMMGLLKIARIASGHSKADNWIDLAGYAALGGELEANEEAKI